MRALAVERSDAAEEIGFGGRPDEGFVAQAAQPQFGLLFGLAFA